MDSSGDYEDKEQTNQEAENNTIDSSDGPTMDAIKLFSKCKVKDFLKGKSGKETTAALHEDVDSDVYKMNHSKRGKAVIFNHKNFSNGVSTRHGTEIDEINLQHCLQVLKFDVVVHRDLNTESILRVLDDLRNEDHSMSDCILIIVLSHGGRNEICTYDSQYKPEELWNRFAADRCPSLAGKPKLFFIQACRGDQTDSGTVVRMRRTQTDSPTKTKTYYKIPNRADLLIVYSTFDGYYSFRNETNGSWFVLELTNVLKKYKDKKDLLSMITIVNRKVALKESDARAQPDYDLKKQVPTTISTLRKEVYF